MPPRQVTTPWWLPSHPIADAVAPTPVKASVLVLYVQWYAFAGPLPVERVAVFELPWHPASTADPATRLDVAASAFRQRRIA